MFKLFLSSNESIAIDDNILSDVAQNLATSANAAKDDIQKLKPSNIWVALQKLFPGFLNFAYQLLVIVVVLFVSSKLISYGVLILKKFLSKSRLDIGVQKFLLSLFRAVSYVIIVLMLAVRVGINSASIIAVLGSAGIAVGLALQGSLSNFAGGILILLSKPFLVGDYIITTLGEGSVHSIGLIYTTIISYDNKKMTRPNGNLAGGVITNLTAKNERMLEIKIGVAYSSDIDKVKDVICNVLSSDPKIIKSKGVLCYIDSFDSSAIIMGMRAWCPSSEFNPTKWRIHEKLKKAFDHNNIEIPFARLDVRIKE